MRALSAVGRQHQGGEVSGMAATSTAQAERVADEWAKRAHKAEREHDAAILEWQRALKQRDITIRSRLNIEGERDEARRDVRDLTYLLDRIREQHTAEPAAPEADVTALIEALVQNIDDEFHSGMRIEWHASTAHYIVTASQLNNGVKVYQSSGATLSEALMALTAKVKEANDG